MKRCCAKNVECSAAAAVGRSSGRQRRRVPISCTALRGTCRRRVGADSCSTSEPAPAERAPPELLLDSDALLLKTSSEQNNCVNDYEYKNWQLRYSPQYMYTYSNAAHTRNDRFQQFNRSTAFEGLCIWRPNQFGDQTQLMQMVITYEYSICEGSKLFFLKWIAQFRCAVQ